MATIREKIHTITFSTIHSILDRAIDMNSIGAVQQHVRELEQALDDVRMSAAQATGNVTTLQRQCDQGDTKLAELDHNIDFILTDSDASNDNLAVPLQQRYNSMKAELDGTKAELEGAKKTAEAMQQAVTALTTKHEQMVGQLSTLEATDRAAKAKEKAADALSAAGAAFNTGADSSVDDITAKIQARADVADARLAQQMGGFTDTVDHDVANAQAQADLAARKARLAAAKAPANA